MRLPVFFMWTPQVRLKLLRQQLQRSRISHGALQASQPEGNGGQQVPLALLMRDKHQLGPRQLPPFRRTTN